MCLALQSVEKDLKELSQMQKKISGVSNYVHKTPLGILLPRRGGRLRDLFVKKFMSRDADRSHIFALETKLLSERTCVESIFTLKSHVAQIYQSLLVMLQVDQ